MKKLLAMCLPILCYAGISEDLLSGPVKADEITTEWLLQTGVKDHDTEHILVFQKIFELIRVKTLMEFGLGYPTKYFLEHCNKVISVDIITHGYGPGIMQKFLKLYADYSNWIPISFFSGYLGWDYSWAPYKHLGSEAVYKATSYQHAYHKHYANIDDFYLVELNAFIANLVKYNKAEVAFIGHAIFLRGDLVELFFNKVPIIVAHNTRDRWLGVPEDTYGLTRVAAPDNYEEIYFPTQGGTTAWVQKKERYTKFIEELKKAANEI
ncbi:MAG: hypothetical protein WCF19_05440 [Chlamydiales bacterium]